MKLFQTRRVNACTCGPSIALHLQQDGCAATWSQPQTELIYWPLSSACTA
jgi:hypothetical protein